LVSLWWCITSNIHLLHLLLSFELFHLSTLFSGYTILLVSNLLLSLLLLFFVGLLCSLDALELFKHILVVQKSVGKFIPEVSTIKELTDTRLN
jgi:hypothetical protein